MKKSMAVILLGSALLMPNNNSAEASYNNNDVNQKAVQNVQYYVYKGKFSSYNPEEINHLVNKYVNGLEKYLGENVEFDFQTSTKPVTETDRSKTYGKGETRRTSKTCGTS